MTVLIYKHSTGFVRFAGARAEWVWDEWIAALQSDAITVDWPRDAPGEYVPPVAEAERVSQERTSALTGHGANVVRKPSGFWTEGDQADLEALTWGLADAALEHRGRCAACTRRQPCAALDEALGFLLDWRRGRMLLSRAAKVRRLELAAELRRIRADLAEQEAAA